MKTRSLPPCHNRRDVAAWGAAVEPARGTTGGCSPGVVAGESVEHDASHRLGRFVTSPWLASLDLLALLLVSIAFGSSSAQAESPVAPGAQLQKLAGGFGFTEGPTCDTAGNIYFTDQPNDRIMEWNVAGELSRFLQPCGRANGMFFDRHGNLIACADEKNELWSIAPDRKVTVLVRNYQGKLLNGPNDVWVRPDDGLYFTDPYYPRSYWKRGPKEMGEHVYFLSGDRRVLKRVTEDLRQPNGISGTPDGKRLYVADIGAGKTYAYDIQPDGALANRQ
ncbi:MAG: SMP-30/gluconolactonase/LRE family protein, partial [Verrucomicrobia bacterium]|nr:SMP-30/gluconolactonase/LRE family protein [Verrucomicrobiota bacterium]